MTKVCDTLYSVRLALSFASIKLSYHKGVGVFQLFAIAREADILIYHLEMMLKATKIRDKRL